MRNGGGGELRGTSGHREHTERKECHGASQDKLLQNHSAPATAAQTFPYLNRSPRKPVNQVKMAVSSYRKQSGSEEKRYLCHANHFTSFGFVPYACTTYLNIQLLNFFKESTTGMK